MDEVTPPNCDACTTQLIRIKWSLTLVEPIIINSPAVESGNLLLGNDAFSREDDSLDWICTFCEPSWLDVHNLVVRDCKLQLEKEALVREKSFQEAAEARDQQYRLRPVLDALVKQLLETDGTA